MTTMKQRADPSSEVPSYASIPAVEWTPLDELAHIWANFGRATTIATAFQAVGAAFSALALETSARQSYTEAMLERQRADRPLRQQSLLITALTDLNGACQKWVQVEHWLARFTLIREETSMALVIDLVLQVDMHRTHLFRLFLRLLEEAGTCSDELTRVLVGQSSRMNDDREGAQ